MTRRQWIHLCNNTKNGIANHDCTRERKIYCMLILWMSTFALLLNLLVNEMFANGIEYSKQDLRLSAPSDGVPQMGPDRRRRTPCRLLVNLLPHHATPAPIKVVICGCTERDKLLHMQAA